MDLTYRAVSYLDPDAISEMLTGVLATATEGASFVVVDSTTVSISMLGAMTGRLNTTDQTAILTAREEVARALSTTRGVRAWRREKQWRGMTVLGFTGTPLSLINRLSKHHKVTCLD